MQINSVAGVGGGTMGSGIAAACAAVGRRVLLLEVDVAAAAKVLGSAVATAQSPAEAEQLKALIRTGTIASDLAEVGEYDRSNCSTISVQSA